MKSFAVKWLREFFLQMRALFVLPKCVSFSLSGFFHSGRSAQTADKPQVCSPLDKRVDHSLPCLVSRHQLLVSTRIVELLLVKMSPRETHSQLRGIEISWGCSHLPRNQTSQPGRPKSGERKEASGKCPSIPLSL